MEIDNYVKGVTSSSETNDLTAAMVAAMKEFQPVRQSGENKFARYAYETQGDLSQATFAAMLKHGVRLSFSTGFLGSREVMVGRLTHSPSGQWESAMVPLIYPKDKKTGEEQYDGQGAEAADTYARKRLIRSLTACWVAGPDSAVEQDNDKQAVDEMVEQADEEQKARKASQYDRIRQALLMCKANPKVLAQKLAKAEAFCQDGKISEEELIALQEEFPC